MRKCPSLWRWLTAVLVVMAYAPTASPQTPAPIRIMLLGDSITYGTGSTGIVGYRRPLYQLLIETGYHVDFIGSQTSGSPADFDRNHEGHSGWRADQIRDNITAWLNSTPADVVLLHIGTNDISQGQNPSSTRNEIGQILDLIDTWEATHNPVWVALARIINRNDWRSGTTTTLNGLIQGLADTRIAAGDRIVVVDMENALSYPGDLADTVHPNDSGYGKMAAAWFAEIMILPPLLPNSDDEGDADVDGYDLSVFITAFGSAAGDLNYDARRDLDSNGIVSEDDLALFAQAFGD